MHPHRLVPAREPSASHLGLGRVVALYTTAHPLYTRAAAIFGTTVSEASTRLDPTRTTCAPRSDGPSGALTARAGNHRFGLLSQLRAHIKAPYKTDFATENAKGKVTYNFRREKKEYVFKGNLAGPDRRRGRSSAARSPRHRWSPAGAP